MKKLILYFLMGALACSAAPGGSWRQANEKELKALIPAKAPVEKEQIETELRTASGVTNGHGKFFAGVALNTAGYAAADKYSTFLIVQKDVDVSGIKLAPGEYVFGWQRRGDDSLVVKFYDAHTGQLLGSVDAVRLNRTGRIDSFRISPPAERSDIEIGRFGVKYTLGE